MKSNLLLVIAILPLLFSAYFLFLKDPPVWPDEYSSLQMTKHLFETGRMNAGHYGGIPAEAVQAGLGFPPLYFATLGAWTSIFGESIEAVRSLSLVIGMLCVVVFYFIVKSTPGVGPDSPGVSAFLGTLVFAFNVNLGKASRFGRPEILTLLFILLTLFCLFRTNSPRGWARTPPGWTVLASIAASLAFATHPMGLITLPILSLSILLKKNSTREKLKHFLILGAIFTAITISWILLTQESLPAFIQALQLGSLGKLSKTSNLLDLLTSGSIWSVYLVGQLIIVLFVILEGVKQPIGSFLKILSALRASGMTLALSTILTILWVVSQKENYYAVYIVPFIILCALSLFNSPGRWAWTPSRWLPVGFLLIFNLYFQFLYIDSYTPQRPFWKLKSFNYHQFTTQVKDALTPTFQVNPTPRVGPDSPGVKSEVTLFLASIPDPSFDLKDQFKIYQAIDPNYPIDEGEYKKTLDQSDYVLYTWLPHDFLAYYLQNNTEELIPIVQPEGYSLTIAKLKPKSQRN